MTRDARVYRIVHKRVFQTYLCFEPPLQLWSTDVNIHQQICLHVQFTPALLITQPMHSFGEQRTKNNHRQMENTGWIRT